MSTKQDILKYLEELKSRLSKELPRITKEIKVYEEKLAKGETTKNPKASPQFNG
ncbi:hypothetical protein [Pseudotamlana carrageenivorans]|uniref:hypothetical protein n=1 Tax=Pseudotamlana carrageenivorans TaxID=2069432 RepID=UPI00131559F4|nr:hypothetical protein [Tamlana carrageenivorans]